MRIITRTDEGANAIPARSYPSLEHGSDAFPAGNYQFTVERAGERSSVILHHEIVGAPLIQRLIDEKVACFACAVSAPRSGFRQFNISPSSRQVLRWDRRLLGEPPYFSPSVVLVEPHTAHLQSTTDGVHSIWDGVDVEFPKGALLAVGSSFQFSTSGFAGLIRLRVEENLEYGQFVIKPSEDPVFTFVVDCTREFYNLLIHREPGSQRRNDAMVHIVSACLRVLKEKYSDPDPDQGWAAHSSLRRLAEELERHDLPQWSETDFEPEQVATAIHPYIVGASLEKDDA